MRISAFKLTKFLRIDIYTHSYQDKYLYGKVNKYFSGKVFSCVDGRSISINFYADKYLSGEIYLV